MTIENNLTAGQVINDILLGAGIEAEDITINGLPDNTLSTQLGVFDAVNSNLGLSRGIILATGGVTVAESPNDYPTAFVAIAESDQLDIEPDLEQIMSPANLKDVGVVEFDFTAQGDTLRFKYVFASEEYNEHVCSPYNDAFGFFISGPGIVGNPNYANAAKNVALIPNTNVPVAINTVNRGVPGEFGNMATCNAASPNWQANHIYFVDNENNPSPNATQFDGFTVPFLVEIPVICGETYHIKMAIADASDRKNDSAVFIEAGSFTSTPPLIADLEIINPDLEGRPIEGCSTYRFTLSRADSSRSKTYYIRSEGLSNPTEIIPGLPDSITLYSQDGIKSFDVEIENDLQNSGLRNFQILFIEPEACSLDSSITTLAMSVFDNPALEVSYNPDITLNCVESGEIDIAVSGGQPAYEIQWNNTDYEGFNFTVSPENNLSLSANISDFCGVNQQEIQINVSRQEYPLLNVGVPEAVSYNCVNPVVINPIVEGGFGEYSYQWIQNGNLIHTGLTFNQIVTSDAPITLVVSDLCVPDLSRTILVAQETSPLTLDLGEDLSGACNTNFAIVPQIEGGFGEMNYLWKVNNQVFSNSPSLISEFSATSVISLTIMDACGTQNFDELTVYIQTQPLSVSMTSDTALCKNERLVLNPILSGGHGDRTYFWNGQESISSIYSAILSANTVLRFRVEDKCGYSIEKICEVEIKDVVAHFEFDYENQFRPIINYSTKNSWYDWFFANGDGSNHFEPLMEYDALKGGTTTLLVRNEIGCEAETRRKYDPPFRVFLPNAFTPDGDGKNNIFKAEGQYVDSFELMVFNRWGKMIFKTNDFTKGWNGEGADENYSGEANVYTYRYRAEDAFGRVDEGSGTVHLLR
ncbi:gliding motility-associated C-terminal domain-containing protein [Cryomorpha ignava]|uniref:Gliding motility-associated C-terminal domain-containing protein n=1 Tax=Cryomorpha ignava TaxID=101383 RepID=A0A7K3WTG3_9FLAO|nr:choice-of-anchor L domain-containing protein [Cryomorpha ignava]NEN24766.1 gliding motility-associated C-terminal domain-containing protein [Cryomorpha ignava]